MAILARVVGMLFSLSVIVVYFRGGANVVKDIRQDVSENHKHAYPVVMAVMGVTGFVIFLLEVLISAGILKVIEGMENPWIVFLGTALIVVGITSSFIIRYGFLGKSWSAHIGITKDHALIDSGPYRVVRHPIYATTLLTYSGGSLAFAAPGMWFACALMILGYFCLTIMEDRYLETNLAGYVDYQRQTKYKLIPGVW